MGNNRVSLYSYIKVWRVEKKIYSFQNFKLPIAINPYDFLSFLGTAVVILIIGRIFPGFTVIPTVIRFIFIPYGISKYLMKKKLDGKNPLKYLFGCVRYLFTEKGYNMQGFRKSYDRQEKIRINWECSIGIRN